MSPRIGRAAQSTGFGKELLAQRPSFVRTGDELLTCPAELNAAVYVSRIKKLFVEILHIYGPTTSATYRVKGGTPTPLVPSLSKGHYLLANCSFLALPLSNTLGENKSLKRLCH